MRAISAVAVNVFKESVRDRVPAPRALRRRAHRRLALLGQLTAGQDVKIIKDLGLAAATVFGLFIAIFIGIGLVSKEVERRSIYSLLAGDQPAAVHHRNAGWCGPFSNVAVMTLALYAVLAYLTFAAWNPRGMGLRPRPAAARGHAADLPAADAHHGDRAVLLDVLDAAPPRR